MNRKGGKGGRVVYWVVVKGGNAVSWKGGKGGRIVRQQSWAVWRAVTRQVWKDGGQVGSEEVTRWEFRLFVSDANQ